MKSESLPPKKDMLKAIADRDKRCDAVFFYGVITTGIYCYPSCSSRQAKPENIRFFANNHAALAAGYRPCKKCQPIRDSSLRSKLIDIAYYIENNASETLTLSTLAKRFALSASQLQRQFKNELGITPKVYQEAVRFRNFKHALQQGPNITQAILSSGYGSSSRIYSEPSRNLGMSHSHYRNKGEGEEIYYACRNTELGLIMMAATEHGVCFTEFGDSEKLLQERLESEFSQAKLFAASSENSYELDLWMDALIQHINNGLPKPDVPLDIRGTAFQIKVWQFLLSVQDDDVLRYSDVAKKIGQPKAVRAVATACARNRIGVLIPCHRVLRSDVAICSTITGAIPSEGSSSRSSVGLPIKVRAMVSICCSPPESALPRLCRRSSKFGKI